MAFNLPSFKITADFVGPTSIGSNATISFTSSAVGADRYFWQIGNLGFTGSVASTKLSQGTYSVFHMVASQNAGSHITKSNYLSVIDLYISATGGTINEYTVGATKYRSHTFNSSGVFEIISNSGNFSLDYLVIGGGGGGGGGAAAGFGNGCFGGGGGAGGYRASGGGLSGGGSASESPLTLSIGTYSVVIGAGGNPESRGNTSSFSTISSDGGGYGGQASTDRKADDGGSGGGGAPVSNSADRPGGLARTGQGRNGGDGAYGGSTNTAGGGGGGASQSGTNATTSPAGGNGGAGQVNNLRTGSDEQRGGGGGGGNHFNSSVGSGGAGGGANAQPYSDLNPASPATQNTGGGGGGGSGRAGVACGKASAGGSGIVIIRYEIAP